MRGVPVAGYFLDVPGVSNSWRAGVQRMVAMQNITSAAHGGVLIDACVRQMTATGVGVGSSSGDADSAWACFLPPVMEAWVKRPMFILNSRFDAWQLANINGLGCIADQTPGRAHCDATERSAAVRYGEDFDAQLAPALSAPRFRRGAFITTCVCHGCPWSALALGGRSAYQALGEWLADRNDTNNNNNVRIDARGPDGNGTLNSTTRMQTPEDGIYMCANYP